MSRLAPPTSYLNTHWLHGQQPTTVITLLLLEAQFDWSLVLHSDWLMLGGVYLNL